MQKSCSYIRGFPHGRFYPTTSVYHKPPGVEDKPTRELKSCRPVRYHGRMDDFEKRWQRIQDQLLAQMNGAEPRAISSGKTLFGIRSEVEKKIDRFAREIEDSYREQRAAERERRRSERNEG